MAVIVPALVAAGIGAYSIYSASEDKKEAERQIKNTPRPKYNINPEEIDNLALRRTMAGQGIGGATRRYLLNGANQGLSSTIGAILRGGGDANDINTSYLRYNDSMGRFAMLDDQMRVRNIDAYIQERRRMSDNRDKEFQMNEYAPYADARTAAYGTIQSANSQINQGIGMIGTAAINGSESMMRRDAIQNMRYGNGRYSLSNSRYSAEDEELMRMLSGVNTNSLFGK